MTPKEKIWILEIEKKTKGKSVIKKGLLALLTSFIIAGGFFCFSICESKKNEISVIFTPRVYDPLIKRNIQGKGYVVHVDLGSCEGLCINEAYLEQIIKKDLNKICKTRDLKGNEYCSSVYLVSNVQSALNEPLECEIIQEDNGFIENAVIWSSTNNTKKNYQGRIGWPYFKNHVVHFDFPNSSIYVSDDLQSVKRGGGLSKFISVPFTIEQGVLMVDIDVELGKQKVVLDTGSRYSILKIDDIDQEKIKTLPNGMKYYKTNKLVIGECDFGDWSFACADLSGIEGIIGVDFFLEHSAIFDFSNQIVYIEKPKGVLGTQWKRLKFYFIQFLVRKFSEFSVIEEL